MAVNFIRNFFWMTNFVIKKIKKWNENIQPKKYVRKSIDVWIIYWINRLSNFNLKRLKYAMMCKKSNLIDSYIWLLIQW